MKHKYTCPDCGFTTYSLQAINCHDKLHRKRSSLLSDSVDNKKRDG